MKETLYIVRPREISDVLMQMLKSACSGYNSIELTNTNDLPDLRNKKLLLAVDLNEAGYCMPIFDFITKLYHLGDQALRGAEAALLIYSPNDFNTKSAASDILFQLNQIGCSFPGHPVVEAVGNLINFRTWQKTMPLSLLEICMDHSAKLGRRLMEHKKPHSKPLHITALHASSNSTSNTMALWNMIKENLGSCVIAEHHVENGSVMDCKGCSFKTCLHYSKQSSCFYGGAVVEEIYPSIEKADAVVWICPNYNDTVSANISAVINRLTALYRKTSFESKALFAVIVSGNSGSDSVAMQLLDALCINKGFYLPAYFCITATANDPGSIFEVADISNKACTFAGNILNSIEH